MEAPRSTTRTPEVPTRSARAVVLTPKLRAMVARDAIAFLSERYTLDQASRAALAAVPIRWRRAHGASAFYPRPTRGFEGPHIRLRVPPGGTGAWHTYRRTRARFSTPRGGLLLPTRVLATTILIHEYTHALQHGVCGTPKRRFSEVETTGNEIEYIRRAAPEAFARLVPMERKAPQRATRHALAHKPSACKDSMGETCDGRASTGRASTPGKATTGKAPTGKVSLRAAAAARAGAERVSGLAALRAIILRFGATLTGLAQPAPATIRAGRLKGSRAAAR